MHVGAMLLAALGTAAASPDSAAHAINGWAPRLHEALRAAADQPAAFAVMMAPDTGAPPTNLTLRSLFAPFADKLARPYIKLTRGAGEPAEQADLPCDVDEAVDMVTRPRDAWSIMLRLEELDSYKPGLEELEPSDADENLSFRELLAPVLPLSGNRTAHLYVSGRGASALPNHTDVTEIVVLQLLGRKTWIHCREKQASDAAQLPFLDSPKHALGGKLDKCSTYGPDDMADLECDSVTSSPGDVLFLPRRTIHSARALNEAP